MKKTLSTIVVMGSLLLASGLAMAGPSSCKIKLDPVAWTQGEGGRSVVYAVTFSILKTGRGGGAQTILGRIITDPGFEAITVGVPCAEDLDAVGNALKISWTSISDKPTSAGFQNTYHKDCLVQLTAGTQLVLGNVDKAPFSPNYIPTCTIGK